MTDRHSVRGLTKLVVAAQNTNELPSITEDDEDLLWTIRFVPDVRAKGQGGYALSTRSTREPEVVNGIRASISKRETGVG